MSGRHPILTTEGVRHRYAYNVMSQEIDEKDARAFSRWYIAEVARPGRKALVMPLSTTSRPWAAGDHPLHICTYSSSSMQTRKREDKGMSLHDDPFDYQTTKNGQIRIYRSGQLVTVVAGTQAAKLLTKLERADEDSQQQLLARATGNYKRGNEGN